jgi:glycosyltransferase involved in cell wall biosynthesis
MSIRSPAIAVVMPVYNRAAAVGHAIQSVLAQDFGDFEMIVVDDGSTDGTGAAVEAITDPRLRFIRLPANAGGNAARNRGIEAANAPLIAFLDSDDSYLPNKLGYTVHAFAERPEMDVLLDSFIKRYPDRSRPDIEVHNPVLGRNEEIVEALFNRRIWKATPGITARREVILAAGLFDEDLRRRQDFDFILRLAKVAQIATTDELLWVKTYSADTISGSPGNFVKSTLDFYRRHPEYYANPAYRPGFAHDLGRHFVRLARKREIKIAWRDARSLAKELGWLRLLGLILTGIGLFSARRRAIRQGS